MLEYKIETCPSTKTTQVDIGKRIADRDLTALFEQTQQNTAKKVTSNGDARMDYQALTSKFSCVASH